MQLSISVTNYSWPEPDRIAEHLLALARRVDEAGITNLWVADHLLQMDPTADIEEPMLESYTTLGFLAGATSRVGLGTMVTWDSIRPPALLIKAVTTLDVLSAGRAWLGIGAGYQDAEARMLGLPFPATPERFDRLEETLQLADHMWNGEAGPFHGAHHTLERPISQPAPIRRPRVLIGGTGERRTLPLVARYADACNLFDIPDGGATIRHKLDVLADACASVGRDRSEIETTISSRLAPGETTAEFVDRCAVLGGLGIDHVVLVTSGPWQDDDLDVILRAVDRVPA